MKMKTLLKLLLLPILLSLTNGIKVFKNVNMSIDATKISHIGVNVAHDKMLNTTAHASYKTTNEKDCIIKCLFQPNGCKSLNYYKGNISPKENCFLLDKSWFEHMELLKTDESSTHIYVKNTGCEKKPCLNGGKCIPNYYDDSFICACVQSYLGKYCENKPEIPFTAYNFTFENGLENSGFDPNGMRLSMLNGKLIYVPERPGKVLSCGNLQCVNTDGIHQGWLNPWKHITITFWVKLRYMMLGDTNDPAYRGVVACPINAWGTGVEICYHRLSELWSFSVYETINSYFQLHPISYNNARRWHHIAMVWNETTLRGYVNGKPGTTYEGDPYIRAPGDLSEWILFNTDFKPNGNENNPMYIDNFNIWNVALSDDNIITIYNSTRF